MTRPALWLLGVSCHAWRNRRFLLWLLLAVPVVTTAAVRLMDVPSDLRPEVMR
jgi:hypothetical protein